MFLFLLCTGNLAQAQAKFNPLKYVNPFIGTDYHGHVFLGASVPFGGIQAGPTNVTRGWDWCSGYHYSSREIVGFTHTHLSGTGIGDWNDILILPATGNAELQPWNEKDTVNGYGSHFSHQNEHCTPGYYDVFLDRYGVKVALTTTKRCAMHQYTFTNKDNPHILIDPSFSVLWNKPIENGIEIVNDSTLLVYSHTKGWADDQRVYAAIQVQGGFDAVTLYQDGESIAQSFTNGTKSQIVLYPRLNPEGRVKLKIGLSAVSTQNALDNLKAEIPDWDFQSVLIQAQNAWRHELSKVRITASDDIMQKYYTAMFHTYFFPALFQDVDGRYRAANMSVKQDTTFTNYTLFSLWDTYRAFHPWMTIVQPERSRDFIRTMLEIYKDQGKLPVWHLSGNETNTMVGLPAIPVVADAYMKGLIDDQYKPLAYEAVINTSHRMEDGLSYVNKITYIPADSVNEATAKGLEYAIADGAIALLAKQTGNKKDYELYTKRAHLYKKYFDPKTDFMRGRMADGKFREPFNPIEARHRENDYCEGNGWQYTWLVPQDPDGLIDAMGGDKKFTRKLDQFFITTGDMGKEASIDISGMIGQYAQGNEPNHHIIYLYNYAGEQWKAARLAREVMDTFYTSQPNGLCGNEDAGQMSAWYTFSAMGFYPVNPFNGIYCLGSPEINEGEIHLPGGKVFRMKATNNSPKNIYIQSATFNGIPYTHSYITHDMIMQGGTLELMMGPEPNFAFGSKAADRPK